MLRCRMNKKKNRARVKAGGKLSELVTESAAIIRIVYESLAKTNPEAAKEYRRTLMGVLLDPNSPIFKKGADLYE